MTLPCFFCLDALSWGPAFSYKTNYVTDQEGAKRFASAHGASLFDAEVVKVTKGGKPVRRNLMLTKDALYKADGAFKVNARR